MSADSGRLAAIVAAISNQQLPPVDTWNPSRTDDIDIRIAANGDWFHQGSHIRRSRMVRLFSSVLRVDDDGHTYLVTPLERLRIVVEDAPFMAVGMERHGVGDDQTLVFTTNVGDQVIADAAHPIIVEYAEKDGEPSPYVVVRDKLRAKLNRAIFYDLAEQAIMKDGVAGVFSGGFFMRLGESADHA